QGFYRHNHVRLDGDELFRFEACTEKVISNPNRETLKRIVDVAELRDKALILLMAQSGLSVANVVELRLENIDFNRTPSLITAY
ncbi:MAG: hypothetical protein GTO54_09005, partial [Nitrososphaeria archaeon]|nr:hypothetical protein [Nitrososphaeria archaeon]